MNITKLGNWLILLSYNCQYEILFCIQDLEDSVSYKFIKVRLATATNNPDDLYNREHGLNGFTMMDVFFMNLLFYLY